MRKLLYCSLIVSSVLVGAKSFAATNWSVTDTTIADGYYRIHVFDQGDGPGTKCYGDSLMGLIPIPTDVSSTFAAKGLWALFAESNTSWNTEGNMNYVWHIIRHSDGSYTMKNCGTQTDTYLYPNTDIGGYAGYVFGMGKEMCHFYFRTKDYGSNSDSPDDYMATKSTKDTIQADRAGYCYIVPTTNWWRLHVGGSQLIKLNSQSDFYCGAFKFVPVDITGKKAWLALNEAMTDAKGPRYSVGVNPGMIRTEAAMTAFTAVMDEAQTLFDNGALMISTMRWQLRLELLQLKLRKTLFR